MEEYRLFKHFDDNHLCYLKGDDIYVSNKGNVRLNDEQLTIGHGLCIKKKYYTYICAFDDPLYRIVYRLFVGEIPYDGKETYNIHHVDYNKLNDSVDNLKLLTSYQHGKIHSDDVNNGMIDYLLEQNEQLKQLKRQNKQSYKYLRERRDNIKQEQKRVKRELYEQKLKQQREHKIEKKKQKQLRIQQMIDNGEAYYSANGKLVYRKTIEALHSPQSVSRRVYTGKKRGSHKGHTPWNKGKTGIYGDEYIEKLRVAAIKREEIKRQKRNHDMAGA